MATIENVFLNDIINHPDDDTPRLIYADWLEEHGETDADITRAEFIRLQCTLSKMQEENPEREKARLREEELLRQHKTAWEAHLPHTDGLEYTFLRGMVERVRMVRRHFRGRAKTIFDCAPIQELELVHPEFDRFREELWRYRLPEEESLRRLTPIIASAFMKRLRRLLIRGYSQQEVPMLLANHHSKFAQLRILEIEHCAWDSDGLNTLATGSFPSLAQLRFSGNTIGGVSSFRTLEQFASSQAFPSLISLDLSGERSIGHGDAELFLQSEQLKSVSFHLSAREHLGTYYTNRLREAPRTPMSQGQIARETALLQARTIVRDEDG